MRDNPKIEIIWNTAVTEVLGGKKVEGVRLKRFQFPISNFQSNSNSQLSNKKNENFNIENSMKIDNSKIENLKLDGLFIAIGHRPDTDLFKLQIELDGKGYIRTFNRLGEDYLRGMIDLPSERIQKLQSTKAQYGTATSVDGVFAAGDCVDYQYRQAGTAVGMGIGAALDVERWLEINK